MGVRLWVDHRCVGTVYENTGYHPRWSPQLLKFAPHFDTLLAARYLFDRNDNYACEINSTYTKVDRDSKVYCLSTINNGGLVRAPIDTIVVLGNYPVSKGVVSLQNDKGTLYNTYIQVQNEIVRAINEIRDEFSTQRYGKKYAQLDEAHQKIVKEAIPQNISEAEPKDVKGKK
ncbi:MAG: hypothetical protein II041_06570 [Bacteroidales bacterium]|nr:hypothetical protein [Bacteroidales bacterium]